MAMETAGLEDGDASFLEDWVMARNRLSNPWNSEPEIHLQHIKEKRISSNRHDQDFAATYPPYLDLALPPNATQQPCTLFDPQSYQTVQSPDWQKPEDTTTLRVKVEAGREQARNLWDIPQQSHR